MKIVICGSMHHSKEMRKAKKILEEKGFEVEVPKNTEYYADETLPLESKHESTKNKIEGDLFKNYFEKIKEGDLFKKYFEKIKEGD